MGRELEIVFAWIADVEDVELFFDQPHAAVAVGAVHAVGGADDVGAAQASLTSPTVGAFVTALAVCTMRAAGGARAPLAVGTSVAILAVGAEHAAGARLAILALEGRQILLPATELSLQPGQLS